MEMLLADARAWCRGRSWPARAPLLAWLAWILIHHLADPGYTSLFGGLNLGVHELGHPLFSFLGDFMGALGGSLLQCLAPVLSAAMFARQRDYFAIAACAGWLSTNLFEVARYVGDARALELPLVTPFGGEPRHDWNFLLGAMGLLPWDLAIAAGLRLAAVAAMLAALGTGGWLLWQMRARPV
jgi:hypothetical protein